MEDISLAMLLPRDDNQKEKLGLHDWSAEDQRRAWESAQHFLDESGIRDVITEKINRGGIIGSFYERFGTPDIHERLLDALVQKKNVLIFMAHGDREHLYAPDGTSVAVRDIERLDLSYNRPTVFLFSCEGGKTGKSDSSPALADALKKAGAGVIWSFEEKLDAGEAMSAASMLLDDLKLGKSMMDGIEALVRTLQKLNGPKVYLRVQRNTPDTAAVGKRSAITTVQLRGETRRIA